MEKPREYAGHKKNKQQHSKRLQNIWKIKITFSERNTNKKKNILALLNAHHHRLKHGSITKSFTIM